MLSPQGVIIPNSGHGGISYVFKAFLLSPFMRQQGRPFVATPKDKDPIFLKELIEAGRITPVVDRTHRLSETPAALGYAAEGHARGKVVIVIIAE